MSQTRTCSTCQTPLPADAPEGACPRCLLIAGLESGTGATGGSGGAINAPSPADLAAYFPALEILELIGQGGMGIVYKARQKGLDRLVALKILAPEMADDAAFSDRFTREARALAKLSHANIVGVHEFGESEGLYYFAMEYVDGMNLREALRGGHLKSAEALAIVPQICDALQYAHDNGVVHRDIKPENVLIGTDGQVKIADFGLAKLLSRAPDEYRLTRAGQVMGTPHYMAPEQIETPDDVDHRADIYSLGVVFYEMLTGELPLGRFQAPSRKVQMDVRIDDVVLRALEKAPDRRYQQVSEVKTRVKGLDTPAPAATTPPPPVAAVDGARSRLSKLALWGFLAFPGSVLAVMGGGLLAYGASAGSSRSVAVALVASIVPGIASLVGMVLSISGWVAISRSNGRLHGKAFAILGTFLPMLCVPVSLGWMMLGATRQAVPTAPVLLEGELPPPPMDARSVDLSVARKLVSDVSAVRSSGQPALADVERLMAPSDAQELRAMSGEERSRLAGLDELGLLYADIDSLPRPFADYEIASVTTKPGTGRVEMRAPPYRLAFPIRKANGRWWLSLGRFEHWHE